MGESRPGDGVECGWATRGIKVGLAVGFLALAVGVVQAHRSPATGYELSIYRATPPSFWAGVAVALLVAVTVAATDHRERVPGIALLLGGGGVLAVAALPLVRGYYYYGQQDALTHLGWTREILASELDPFALVYPAGHVAGGLVSTLSGLEPRRALLLVVPVFVLLYLVFVTLTVRELVDGTAGPVVGALVAFLLLPVFDNGASLMFIPLALGILFSAFLVYLLVLYVGREQRELVKGIPVTRLDFLFLGTGVALLVLHPQVFSDVLLLLGSIVVLQFIARLRGGRSRIAGHRLVVGHFLVLGLLFAAWTANHSAATGTLEGLLSLSPSSASDTIIQQRAGSIASVGGNLAEVFAKLFLVKAVVTLFAAGIVVWSLRRGEGTDLDGWARYVAVAGVLVFVYAVSHFFGAVASSYFFRHLSFGMVLASVLGAAGVYLAGRAVSRGASGRRVAGSAATGTGVVLALVAIALSVAVFYPSPYIYNQSHHLPETHATGYETAFEHRADGVELVGIRGGAERYSSALPGVPATTSDDVFGETIRAGLTSELDGENYLIVTEVDRQREVRAYRGLRVSRSDFRRIDSEPGVSRVQSNGGFTMYYMNASG